MAARFCVEVVEDCHAPVLGKRISIRILGSWIHQAAFKPESFNTDQASFTSHAFTSVLTRLHRAWAGL
jgi:hypothetical protein